jgi:hypothetical protein
MWDPRLSPRSYYVIVERGIRKEARYEGKLAKMWAVRSPLTRAKATAAAAAAAAAVSHLSPCLRLGSHDWYGPPWHLALCLPPFFLVLWYRRRNSHRSVNFSHQVHESSCLRPPRASWDRKAAPFAAMRWVSSFSLSVPTLCHERPSAPLILCPRSVRRFKTTSVQIHGIPLLFIGSSHRIWIEETP